MVYSRCLRQLGRDEFRALGFTFRYAEEWDGMSDTERRADVAGRRNAGDGGGVDAAETVKDVAVDNRRYEGEAGTPSDPAEAGRGKHYARKEETPRATHAHYQRGVVAVDREGHEVARWDMVKHAHVDTGVAESTISQSITGKRNRTFVRGVDLAFIDAEEWDDMTEAQRRARLGLD